jgi:hypothetical protein
VFHFIRNGVEDMAMTSSKFLSTYIGWMKSSTSVIVKQAYHILQILVVVFYCM